MLRRIDDSRICNSQSKFLKQSSILILFFLLSSCQKTPGIVSLALTEPVEREVPTATVVTTQTATVVAASSAPVEFDPLPEESWNAAEQISTLETARDFSGSFNADEWQGYEEINGTIYSFSQEYGMLRVAMDPTEEGYSSAFLGFSDEQFPIEVNAFGVGMAFPDPDMQDSYAGLTVTLADDHGSETLRCGLSMQANMPGLQCEVFERDGQRVDERLFWFWLPKYQLHDILIEWEPQSGLVLFFLGKQLLGWHELDLEGPIQANQAGLFFERNNSNDGGAFKFVRLRSGTYRETQLLIPDDLLPARLESQVDSTDILDYFLVDDFDDPLNEGYINVHTWEYKFTTPEGKTLFVFGQDNGVLKIEGDGRLDLQMLAPPEEVRAIRVLSTPENEQFEDGGFSLGLTVRPDDEPLLDYFCSLEFRPGKADTVSCHLLNSAGELLHVTYMIPILDDQPLDIRLAYDDTRQIFTAFLNDKQIDRAVVPDHERDRILRYGILPGVSIEGSDTEVIGLDEILLGIRSDRVPVPESEEHVVVSGLPNSDLFMYDDFEDPDSDLIWDYERWKVGPSLPSESGMYQRDGVLWIKSLAEDEIGGKDYVARDFHAINADQANAIQITVGGDAQYSYQGNLGVHLGFDGVMRQGNSGQSELERDGRGFRCMYFHLGHLAHVRCTCFGIPGCMDYEFGPVELDAGREHKIAVEYAQSEQTFYAYIDGERVTEFPLSGSDFKNYVLFLGSQADALEDTQGVVHIDEVLIGTPAENPDVLRLPETPYEKIDPHALYEGRDEEEDPAPAMDESILATTDHTQYFSPYSLQDELSRAYGWQLDGPIEDLPGSRIRVLNQGPEIIGELSPIVAQSFSLSQINAARIRLRPEGTIPHGWYTGLAMRRNDGTHELYCSIHYLIDGSIFQCVEIDGELPEAIVFTTEEITIDTAREQVIAIEIDPATHLAHVFLNEEHIFEIEIAKSDDFFSEGRFGFRLTVSPDPDTSQDFEMGLEEFWLGMTPQD